MDRTVTTGQPIQAVEHRRTFEQILLQVEAAIVDGRLQPGDKLPAERDLAQTFGVSRASVREALQASWKCSASWRRGAVRAPTQDR